MKKYDVVCIGDATLDITMTGIPANIFEKDSVLASSSKWSVGGDAANQVCVLTSLGLNTALIAKTGDDLIGHIVCDMLSKDNIDMSFMIQSPQKNSGFCIVAVQSDGTRSFLLSMGSGDRDLHPDEINFSILEQTKAISVGSIFCLHEMDLFGTAMVFKEARKKGVLTFADMTGDSFNIGPDAIKDIYPYTDYLLPSLEECIYVTGENEPEKIADFFLSAGVSNVVIKLGSKGCYFKNHTDAFYTPAFATNAIDTTGCGDNFTAAFITGILMGKSAKEASLLGCAAGAINAAAIGAHGNVNSYEQLLSYLESAQPISD